MASKIAELFVQIGADVSDFIRQTDAIPSQLKKSMDSALPASQAVAAGLAAVGAGVAAFALDGIHSLAEIERLSAQTASALKSTGAAAWASVEGIRGLAESLENMSGIEAESIQKGENLLLTFTNIKNGVGAGNDVFNQATKTMLDMSVAMGTDAAGGAIQLGKALNDPKNGITALTRVGVTFTEEQKKQIAALQEAGDMMGAQKIILAELNREFGGSAAAAGQTAIGVWNKMTNALGDIGEAAMTDALPAIKDFGREITAEFRSVAAEIKRVGIAETLTEMVAPTDAAKVTVVALAGAITASLIPAAYAGATAFVAMMAPLAPFALAGAAVAVVAYDIYKAIELWPEIMDTAAATWQLLKSQVQGAAANIQLAAKKLGADVTSYISAMVTGVQTWLGSKLTAAFNLVMAPINAAKKAFFGLYDAVVGHSYIPDMVKETGQHMARLDANLAKPAEHHTKVAKTAFEKMQVAVNGVMSGFAAKMGEAALEFKVTGDASRYLTDKISATNDALRGLFAKGLTEANVAVQGMRDRLRELIAEQQRAATLAANTAPFDAWAASLRAVEIQEQLWGASMATTQDKIKASETAITALAERFGPFSDEVTLATEKWQAFQDQLTNQEINAAIEGVLGKIEAGAGKAGAAITEATGKIAPFKGELMGLQITSSDVSSAMSMSMKMINEGLASVAQHFIETGAISRDEASKMQAHVSSSLDGLTNTLGAFARGDLIGGILGMIYNGGKAIIDAFVGVIAGIGWLSGAGDTVNQALSATTSTAMASIPASVPSPSGFGTKSLGSSGGGGGDTYVININDAHILNDQDGYRLAEVITRAMQSRGGMQFA